MKKLLYALLLTLFVANVLADDSQKEMLENLKKQQAALEAETTKELVVEKNEKGKLEVAKEKVDKVVNFVVKDHPYMSAAVAGTLAIYVVSKLVASSDRFGYNVDGDNKVRSGLGNAFDKTFGSVESVVKFPFLKIADGVKTVDAKTSRLGYNSKKVKSARAWAADNRVTNAISSSASATKGAVWTNRNRYSKAAISFALVAAVVVALYKYLKTENPEILKAINDDAEEDLDPDLSAIIGELS